MDGYHGGSRLPARQLRLALAQINVTVGDLAGNVVRILAAAREARAAGATVVCAPELAIPGYPPEDLLLKPGFVSDNLRALDDLRRASAELSGMTIITGFVDRASDLYNAAAILREGRLLGVYHKQYLPNYGVFDEDRYFSPGRETPTFIIDGAHVGVSICEDIWYPNGSPTLQAYEGAEALLNISASPFHAGKQEARERMLSTRAADTGCIVAYLNLVGGQDELVFDGSSVVFDGRGELIARARAFAEDLLVVDVDVEDVFNTRLHDPRRRKDRDALSEPIAPPVVVSLAPAPIHRAPDVSVHAAVTPALGAPGRIEPLPDRVEEVYRALTLGVGDYVHKGGFSEALVALSGGIDSALTAAIAVDALGADKVIGVSLPSRYSSAGSRDDARSLAEHLGLRYMTIPIEPVFAATMQTLEEPLATFGPTTSTLTEENAQARIRGLLMMALSNRSGAILLSTGNKSEMAVGYATLYGDMAGGFAVLKDVFKTLVWDLSRWRNKQAGHELIPWATIEKTPSAELRPGQQDSDSLPPYETLDPILRAYVEDDRSFDALTQLGFDAETVRRVMAMVDHSEYKRRQSPPGVKITPRAFGRDRRPPITNRYRDEQAAPGPERRPQGKRQTSESKS
ncbi:MAG TPA: NAD+ synthase [Ktedonobacterales bacterium]|jgi:NAD+ synthase (glutamine-hydrolysing)|nr:NAD+ synthase [Ktedonobacterales bacterium]